MLRGAWRHTGRGCALTITVLSALLACTTHAPPSMATGSALSNDGLQASGFLTINKVRIRDEFLIAFPLLRNIADRKVRVLSAQFDHIGSGVRVLAIKKYRVSRRDGYPLIVRLSDRGKPPPLYRGPIEIGPHQRSPYFLGAEVQILNNHRSHISGCRVVYIVGGTRYQQSLDCTFSTTAHA